MTGASFVKQKILDIDTEQYLTDLFSQSAGTIILPLDT